jgi:hypothetical protein
LRASSCEFFLFFIGREGRPPDSCWEDIITVRLWKVERAGLVAHSIRKNLLGGLPFRFWKGWAALLFSPPAGWPGFELIPESWGRSSFSFFPDTRPLTFDFQLPIPARYFFSAKSSQYYRILFPSCY